jgi:hypothetical protein
VAATPNKPEESFWWKWTREIAERHEFEDAIGGAIILMFGALCTYLSGKIGLYKTRLRTLNRRLTGLTRRLSGVRFGLPDQVIESYNRVLLVGMGGTGKTSLIRSLFANPTANPRMKTGELSTYCLVHEIVYQDRDPANSVSHACRIDIDDYSGQDYSQIMNGWKTNPLEDGDVYKCSSVIFMVDLFHPPSSPDALLFPRDRIDQARIKANQTYWPSNNVEQVFSKVEGDNLKYVCLFVNKCDLLNTTSENIITEIKTRYKNLWEAIYTNLVDCECEIVIGSAEKGIGTTRVLNKLIQMSARPIPGASLNAVA